MNRLISIAFMILYLGFSLGSLSTPILMGDHTSHLAFQKGSFPDDRGNQESQEVKDTTNEYCPKSALTISTPHMPGLPYQQFIDESPPGFRENEADIQTPPPDQY